MAASIHLHILNVFSFVPLPSFCVSIRRLRRYYIYHPLLSFYYNDPLLASSFSVSPSPSSHHGSLEVSLAEMIVIEVMGLAKTGLGRHTGSEGWCPLIQFGILVWASGFQDLLLVFTSQLTPDSPALSYSDTCTYWQAIALPRTFFHQPPLKRIFVVRISISNMCMASMSQE